MKEYLTLAHEGTSRYEDRKSVFLGYASSVKTEAEAAEFIGKIKAEYPDARHHVYAYVLRENAGGKYSDDHEPQGSAGMPVLDVLRHGGLTDACVVVVRYFGGTLLGTGGLVKAYATSAADAVAAAETVRKKPCLFYDVSLNYTDYQRFLQETARYSLSVIGTDFTDDVRVSVEIPAEEAEAFTAGLTESTAGRARFSLTGEGYGTFPLE